MLKFKKNVLKYKDENGDLKDTSALFGGSETDSTLSKAGVAADGKVTGDRIGQLSKEIVDHKAYVVSVFEELKALIEAGNTTGAIAVLDKAILDLSVLA